MPENSQPDTGLVEQKYNRMSLDLGNDGEVIFENSPETNEICRLLFNPESGEGYTVSTTENFMEHRGLLGITIERDGKPMYHIAVNTHIFEPPSDFQLEKGTPITDDFAIPFLRRAPSRLDGIIVISDEQLQKLIVEKEIRVNFFTGKLSSIIASENRTSNDFLINPTSEAIVIPSNIGPALKNILEQIRIFSTDYPKAIDEPKPLNAWRNLVTKVVKLLLRDGKKPEKLKEDILLQLQLDEEPFPKEIILPNSTIDLPELNKLGEIYFRLRVDELFAEQDIAINLHSVVSRVFSDIDNASLSSDIEQYERVAEFIFQLSQSFYQEVSNEINMPALKLLEETFMETNSTNSHTIEELTADSEKITSTHVIWQYVLSGLKKFNDRLEKQSAKENEVANDPIIYAMPENLSRLFTLIHHMFESEQEEQPPQTTGGTETEPLEETKTIIDAFAAQLSENPEALEQGRWRNKVEELLAIFIENDQEPLEMRANMKRQFLDFPESSTDFKFLIQNLLDTNDGANPYTLNLSSALDSLRTRINNGDESAQDDRDVVLQIAQAYYRELEMAIDSELLGQTETLLLGQNGSAPVTIEEMIQNSEKGKREHRIWKQVLFGFPTSNGTEPLPTNKLSRFFVLMHYLLQQGLENGTEVPENSAESPLTISSLDPFGRPKQ